MKAAITLTVALCLFLTASTSASTKTFKIGWVEKGVVSPQVKKHPKKHHPVSLVVRAREAALHGVTGHCYGCASAYTKNLVRQVFQKRFAPAGHAAVNTAICLITRESGLNPQAISATGDYGAAQFNYAAHHEAHPEWYAPGRGFSSLIFDPSYNAGAMFAMSRGGTSWTPWAGGSHSC